MRSTGPTRTPWPSRPDNKRVYVAEAGLNSVAVLDTTNPTQPKLLGRIPTDWYPTGAGVSKDGNTLYITNAKGVGEDINPLINNGPPRTQPAATGVKSSTNTNTIFGTLQQVAPPRPDRHGPGRDDGQKQLRDRSGLPTPAWSPSAAGPPRKSGT